MKIVKNITIILFGIFCFLYIVTKPEICNIWVILWEHHELILKICALVVALWGAWYAMLSWRFSTFNSVFTQLMCGHRDVYRKVVNSKDENPFTKFYQAYEKYFNGKNANKDEISDFYKFYLGLKADEQKVIIPMNLTVSINLCAYFKYIYHEVCFINDFKFLSSDRKKKYISMIQAQMSNYELFCYLINQIEHENKEYHQILKENKFFDNLYESALSKIINKISFEERQKLINL